MRLKSVRVQYAVAAAALFGFAFLAASLLAINVVRVANQATLAVELESASKQAVDALKELNQRIASYAKLILAKPYVAEVIVLGDRTKLESMAVNEFKVLKAADPIMSTFEITDAKGIVIIRGHDPKNFGDNKATLKEIQAALQGRTTLGLTVSPTSGQAALDVVAPIIEAEKVLGTLKMGAYATVAFAEEIKQKTGAEVVTLFRGKVTASTFPKDVSLELASDHIEAAKAGQNQRLEMNVGGALYQSQLQHLPSLAGEGLVIATFVASAPFTAKTTSFIYNMATYGIFAIPVVLIFGFALGHAFGRPLVDTATALSTLAKGETAGLARYERSGTEIGDMARAFSTLQEEVLTAFKLRQTMNGMPIGVMTIDRSNDWKVDYVNPTLLQLLGGADDKKAVVGTKASTILASAAVGDDTLEALGAEAKRVQVRVGDRQLAVSLSSICARDGRHVGAMASWEDVSEKHVLAQRFEHAIKSVADATRRMSVDLREHAEAVNQAAVATLGQAEAVARSSEENSVSVTTVAAATDELSASVLEIATQINRSTGITRDAAQHAKHMVSTVQDLNDAAGRIGAVVQMIGTIASQTNLLALNATIEAARAGEAGRGFAVVASEVKALATQTAKAAEDVVAQVMNIQAKTGEAVDMIDQINAIISTVSELSVSISSAVEEQKTTTDEIARNTQQTSSGTQDVAQSITEVSRATQITETASHAMLTQADQLQNKLDELNKEVDMFLKTLAA